MTAEQGEMNKENKNLTNGKLGASISFAQMPWLVSCVSDKREKVSQK